jgi:hypothetical protein
MGKRESALASLLDCQPDAFAKSVGGSYWIDCPKFRNAPHADIYRKPAAATSASGKSRLIAKKSQTKGTSNAKAPRWSENRVAEANLFFPAKAVLSVILLPQALP